MKGKAAKSTAGREGPNPPTHDTTPLVTPSAAHKANTARHGRMPALRALGGWLRRVVTDAIDFRRRAAKTRTGHRELVIIAPADVTERYLAAARAEGYESVSSWAGDVLDEAACV